MVAEALDIERETYLAILMDRELMGPVIVGSPQGGMDIEEVAEKTPELIFKVSVDHIDNNQNSFHQHFGNEVMWKGHFQGCHFSYFL